MVFQRLFPKIKVTCINLKERKDKKIYMRRHAKKKKIDFTFYTAKKHTNPKRGCLESHCNVIEESKRAGYKYVLVLEDDAYFIRSPESMPKLPDQWDMLYLGGNVKHILGSYNDTWSRVVTWCTHAYILNLQNEELVTKILDSRTSALEIDEYYIRYIHPNFACYMVKPMMAIQKAGYSDIEEANVNYDFMQRTLEGFSKPEHIVKDEQYTLKLPDIHFEDLPAVSLVTPTYNRRKYFALPIYCFMNFIYPKEKIEWVVVEEDSENNVKDMLNFDRRIKYYEAPLVDYKPMTIGAKRNLCVEKATNDIIIHMDDDDYYPPETLLARVKLLLKYRGTFDLVGCSMLGSYNVFEETSRFLSDGQLTIGEASMAYWKSFWEEQKFDPEHTRGEYRGLIQNRFNKILDVPYYFIIFALNHKENMTLSKRKVLEDISDINNTGGAGGGSNQKPDITVYWSSDVKEFITYLKNSFLKITETVAV